MRSIADVARVMRALLVTPASHGWGPVVYFEGGAGTGKSSVLEQVARGLALDPFEWLSPMQRGDGYFGGVPVPEGKGIDMVLRYPVMDFVRPLNTSPGACILVDEITCAAPNILPHLLGLLLDRRLGSAQLAPTVRLIAAGNPVASAAAGWDMPSPVANRLIHLPWPATDAGELMAWLGGVAARDVARLRGEQVQAEVQAEALAARLAEEQRVLGGPWLVAWPRATGLVGGYLRAKPAHAHREPAAGSPEASKAWPSPRSWETAMRCVAAAEVFDLGDVLRDELVAGCVGDGVAVEWAAWARHADLPDLAALADGQVQWAPDSVRLDRTCAVASGLGALLASDSDRARAKKRAVRCFKLFGKYQDVDVLRPMMDAAALVGAGARSCPEAQDLYGRLGAVSGSAKGA